MTERQVVIIDERGLRTEKAPEDIGLDYLYSVCCKDTPGNKIVEAASCRFPDETITVWCHEEGRLEPLPSYFVVKPSGEDFAGPVLICGSTDEGVEVGLTPEQVRLVKNSVMVLKTPVIRELY